MSRTIADAPKLATMRSNATPAGGGLLQRQCACGSRTGAFGECEDCNKKRTGQLQKKLRVSAPGDAFELEADRVADRVMAMPAPHGAATAASPAEPLVQRRVTYAPTQSSEHGVPAVDRVLRSSGEPLDAATRAFFEPRFGHDFSRVRVHADMGAAESARAVDASAYTVGEHIVFDASQFDPGSHSGRKLLAHELTHTIQQRSGQAPAHRPEAAVVREAPPSIGMRSTAPQLARQPKPGGAREELEVIEGERSADSSDRPWFVFYDTVAKGDKKALLPAGARVEANGPEVIDVRQGADGKKQRLVFRRVRVLSSPAKGAGADSPIGKQGLIQAKFLAPVKVAAPAPAKPAPPAQSQPAQGDAQAPQRSELTQRALDRYNGLPQKTKWPSPLWATKPRSAKADTAVRMMLTARDFYCSEPFDAETGSKVLERVKVSFTDIYLTDSNFNKHYGNMSPFAKRPLRVFMLIGISGVHQMIGKTKTGQVGAGACGGTWDFHLSEFIGAYEVMAVLAGDLDIKDAKNIKALDDMTSFKGAQAFLSGLLDGAKSELSDDDYKQLASKLSDSTLLSALAPPIIVAGAAVGIAKDLVDALKGLYELVTNPAEMVENIVSLIGTLMTDEEGSRALGQAIGAQEAKKLRAMSKEGVVTFTYKLGEKVGPTVVYTVLSIVTAGAVGGAAYSARLAAFLEKFPKVAKQVKRIKALLPEHKVKPKPGIDLDAPDVPKKHPVVPDKSVPKDATGPSAKAAGDAAPKKVGGKRFPETEAKGLKILAKNPKNLRKVTDKKLLKDGYEFEIPSGEHTYRRRRDGTWCRFSVTECDFTLDAEDDAAFLRAAAMREQAIAAGWAIEDYVGGLGYQRPKASNFPGIDGWKGGKPKGHGVISNADVLQVKGVNDLKHSNVIDHYNEAVRKLMPDSFAADPWVKGDLKIVNPKSRSLHIIFDQDTYSRLGFTQMEELNKLIKTMTSQKHSPPISVRFFYFSEGGKFPIP